ncbi:glycine zipper 2TM domain-containing protein [Ramlibacter sp. AN1133]|uniref:glycine zipper 2TM domain-containing protein n=1 Tax=Ramlibacter sp. AN1133 TaxID=3133429 RepID=UPI0030C1F404
MKQTVLFAALGLVAFGAAAQEGRVLSSQPVIQQVAVPRQNCVQGMVQAQPQTSGMGGLAGAVTGAAIGSQIGGGNGAIAAGLIGLVGGAIAGNSIEANNMRAQQVAVPTCTTETTYENRTVGYDVTYEYAGQQYSTRMPYDPGPSIRLQVTPMAQGGMPAPGMNGAVSAPPVQGIATAPGTVISTAPVMVAAPVVVQPYPVYPAYPYPVYRPYYYPPIGVSLGFVFRGGHGGGHRHWR